MVKTVKPTKPPDPTRKVKKYNRTVENENGFKFRKEPVQSNKADHYVGFSLVYSMVSGELWCSLSPYL